MKRRCMDRAKIAPRSWTRGVMGTIFCAAALTSRLLEACPFCDSEIGQRVSAGIFNADFLSNALLTLLPIPVLLMIVGVIHYGPLALCRKSNNVLAQQGHHE